MTEARDAFTVVTERLLGASAQVHSFVSDDELS